MVKAMCGVKLMERRRTEDLMEMLGLKETVVQMAKANGVRWYGDVLRRDDGHVLRKALEFEVKGMGRESKDDRGRHGDHKWRSGEGSKSVEEGGCKESSKMESGSGRDC